jgi:hypothetical protein
MQWQEHTNFTCPSLPNPTKATNAIRKDERKNKGREHQIPPRSISNRFPHKEERLIGRIVDLDLLSLFPQEYPRIIGGMGRLKAQKGQQWRANTSSKGWGLLGKKPP